MSDLLPTPQRGRHVTRREPAQAQNPGWSLLVRIHQNKHKQNKHGLGETNGLALEPWLSIEARFIGGEMV